MADTTRIHPEAPETKDRTPEQEEAAGFLNPWKIAQWRRGEESGEPPLRLVRDGEEAS